MKNKISAGTVKEVKGPRMTVDDMNPVRLCLYIGQLFQIVKTDNHGNESKKNVQIKKFFKNHALCKVNGRTNECFTYNELATMAAQKKI